MVTKVSIYNSEERWYESRRVWGAGLVILGAISFILGEVNIIPQNLQTVLAVGFEVIGASLGIVSFKYPKR